MQSLVRAAARRAGNPYIVRLAEKAPEPVSALRSGRQHLEVIAGLEASGLPYTTLRPCFYMQNTMLAAPSIASEGMMYMPFQDASLVMVDMRDAIEAAAKVLTTPGHEGQSYIMLTGHSSRSYEMFAGDFAQYFQPS